MRYVDIERLQLPDKWETRAETALDELRTEIQRAEDDARAADKNTEEIAAARKDAISKGIDDREKIWKELASGLAKLSNDKCWYSESINATADMDVDHFRPKKRVKEEPDHEGYWWKAFDWRNYRYSAQWPNRYRNDKTSGTRGGKGDQFPLCSNSFRARMEEDDCDSEEPALLDPTDPNDWKLLTFRPNGEPTPSAEPNTKEYVRAEESISVYHLHCRKLVKKRQSLASQVERLILEMEKHFLKIKDSTSRQTYTAHQKELLRLIHWDHEYSAAALAYARAQVYTRKYGRQVERHWLKDILNSPI